jgi:hypothetical protein
MIPHKRETADDAVPRNKHCREVLSCGHLNEHFIQNSPDWAVQSQVYYGGLRIFFQLCFRYSFGNFRRFLCCSQKLAHRACASIKWRPYVVRNGEFETCQESRDLWACPHSSPDVEVDGG